MRASVRIPRGEGPAKIPANVFTVPRNPGACLVCGGVIRLRNYRRGIDWFTGKVCRDCDNSRRRVGIPRPADAPPAPKTIKNRRWQEKHPEKRAAHKAVELELCTGRMQRRPCEVCGEMRSQAHHEDYSKPLDIMWLCSKHHSQRHREIDREAA